MYTVVEEPEDVKVLSQRSKEFVAAIIKYLTPIEERKLVLARAELFADKPAEPSVYVLREGMLTYARNERTLLFYEEGDLVGLERWIDFAGVQLTSEFAVYVDRYTLAEIMTAARSNPAFFELWSRYLITHSMVFSLLWNASIPGEKGYSPELRHFAEGDVIIEQGDAGSDVYTLLEGHAQVTVNGIKVGEVLPDEIFGAIGPLTGTPRTARVEASIPCLVLILPKTHFVDLIKDRPGTVLKLVEDMARSIVALNQKVIGLVANKS